MPDALPWIAAAVASVVATLGLAQWRSAVARFERERRARLEGEASLESLRAEVAMRERRRDDQSAELQDLRKRLDKAKRRAFEGQAEVEPLKTQLAKLEAELRSKERALADRADALARAEATAAQAQTARDEARAEAHAEVERAAAESASQNTQRDAGAAELDALRGELAALETRATGAERDAARFRQRWRTQQRLYMVLRGELEIAKDRIRALDGSPPRENPHLSAALREVGLTAAPPRIEPAPEDDDLGEAGEVGELTEVGELN